MDELLQQLDTARIRYLLVGGQAMRLLGLPRFSMDWDFFIPPRDEENLARLNELLAEDLDMPLLPLGTRGENFIQTYQTRWGVLQFHLGLPGVPRFDEAEPAAVTRPTERGTPVKCLSGPPFWPPSKPPTVPRTKSTSSFYWNSAVRAGWFE